MHLNILLVAMIIMNPGFLYGQCPGNYSTLTSRTSGSWENCQTFLTSFCCTQQSFAWNNQTTRGSSDHIIDEFDDVVIPFNVGSTHGKTANILIKKNGELKVEHDFTSSQTSNCDEITVEESGDFIIDVGSGNAADFSNAELHVYGDVQLNNCSLKVKKVRVYDGGTLTITNGILLRSWLFKSGFQVDEGGQVSVSGSSSVIDCPSSGQHYTLLDGTLDVGSRITSWLDANDINLGIVNVSSGTSTGLIRTSTGFMPEVDNSETSLVSADFFGSESDHGGTVEYYGNSSVTLSLFGRGRYYSLKVSCPKLILERTSIQVGGVLDLDGDLDLTDNRLTINGGIKYHTGDRLITDSTTARLYILGKYSYGSTEDQYLSDTIIGYSNSTDTITKPEIRLETSVGDTAQLLTLNIYRDDMITLSNPVKINSSLVLRYGQLKTTSQNALILQSNAVSKKGPGHIKGPMKKTINQSGTYHFPIGTNDTSKVEMTFYGVSNSAELEISQNAVPHPSSAILAGALNRYWSITTGLAFDSCYFTLRYNSNDFPSGTSESTHESALAFGKYSGGAWTFPNVVSWDTAGPGGTVTLLLTSFSDVGIGTSPNVLDIDFIYFHADCKLIKWTGVDESEVECYYVMGTYNGQHYEPLDTLREIITGTKDTFTRIIPNIYSGFGIVAIKIVALETNGDLTHTDIVKLDCPRKALKFEIYPNPAQTQISVGIPLKARLDMYTIGGKHLIHQHPNAGTTRLNIEMLPPGIYIITLNGVGSKRFVKN